MTTAIFGFFGSVWFGWAQESRPARWKPWLLAASILSLATMAAGGVLAWLHWGEGTAYDRATGIRFGIVVAVEVVLAGLGAAILGARRHRELIPVWIALIVGVHFFPIAVLIGYPWLHVVAALTTIAAFAAVPIARRRLLPVSAVNGLGVGASVLLGGLVSLAYV